MESKIRILIVDDHAVLRAGLRMLLNAEPDFQVVGEASSASEALSQLESLKPDVVLIDISMPETNVLAMLPELQESSPDSRYLILTMHNDESYLRMALSAGASGYVLKQAANNELLSAIRVVHQGGTYLHRDHKAILFATGSAEPETVLEDDGYERLSPREREILRMIAMGYSNRRAAEELYLSEKTIETYKSRLMVKLNLHSRVEIVRFALRRGLIKP